MNKADCHPDPIRQFELWHSEAIEADFVEPSAMTLATASESGIPSARIVLLRKLDDRGFIFFTNYESRKAGELEANSRAALVFYWDKLHRQVRVVGRVARIETAESEEYFRGRPRGSRIAAWASGQSQVLPDRATLEKAWKELEARFEGQEIPLPPFWGGYCLTPHEIEFWAGREHRMHDRMRYRREEGGEWILERLSP